MKRRIGSRAFSCLLVVLLFGLLPVKDSGSRGLSQPFFAASQSGSAATSPKNPPGQTRTLLPDGTLLLLGGEGPGGPLTSAQIENPQTGTAAPLQTGMLHAREWQSATVVPSGKVLIFGGVGSDGHVVRVAEVFDPATKQFANLPPLGVTPRAHHTATLLTDGTVLFAGGVDDGDQTLRFAQIWDPRTNTVTGVPGGLLVPRSDQAATLQADGTVLLWGGKDSTGMALNYGELYDPETRTFQMQSAPPLSPQGTLQAMATIPLSGTEDVPVNVLIAVRFSKPIRMDSANANTIVLSGPDGDVSAQVAAAEGGMLAFITPQDDLLSGTAYEVDLHGIRGDDGSSLPSSSFTFETAGPAPSAGGGVLLPTAANWPGGPKNSPYLNLPPLQAPPGVTAIAGQVLLQSGLPLKDVTLRVGSDATRSDGTGRFLLKNVPSGYDVLVMDGRTANAKTATYGVFEVGDKVTAGETNILNYTIWMPTLDMAHVVTIPVPTTQETVITTPLIPGLEFYIPAGTTITDIDDKTVNQVSITPIPISQPPFPLPPGVNVPTYFTIQPGGGWIWTSNPNGPKGGWLVYPNTYHQPPGTPFDFWNYDAKSKGWYVYGSGKVSPDQKSVVPNPGVVIYTLTGAMFGGGGTPGSGPCGNCEGGDPVDLGTGLFVYRKVDLSEPDVIPIILRRTYRQNDSATRAFGIGASLPYNMFLVGSNFPYTYVELVFADGAQIEFNRISATAGHYNYSTAEYENISTPGPFFGATIVFDNNNTTWVMTLRNGTKYVFPDSYYYPNNPYAAALLSITDRNGNTLTITRSSAENYNITKITSPNGRWIEFTEDSNYRITQATDELGRTVTYTYDTCGAGLLCSVTDANGGLWKYTYDSNDNMTSITNPRNITYLTNKYDSLNRVIEQDLPNSGSFKYSYTTDSTGNITETDVTDPNGNVEKVLFNPPQIHAEATSSPYVTDGTDSSVTYASGTSVAATYSHTYQPGTNLLTSVTDPLGRETTYTYDLLGNIMSVTRLAGTPNAVTTNATYDDTYSQVTSLTDPLGLTTTFGYDSSGNLVSNTDPMNNVTTFANDGEGRVVSVTDAAGEKTQFAYDGPDISSITNPLSQTTQFIHDAAGRLIGFESPLGQVTQYSYNPLDQIISITDALGGVTSITYDGDGNVLTVADAQHPQNPTTYTYDTMDRLATRSDPIGDPAEQYVYDYNGNLTSFTDSREKVTTYQYDALNRLSFAGYGTQPGPTYENTINYSYDAGNRLTQAMDSVAGTFNRSYDGLDRLTQEQGPEGTVAYQYDADGRRTQLTVSGQSSPVTYSYDNDNRLTGITQGTAGVSFAYDAAGRRTSLTLPNGIVVGYNYDQASELTGLTYSLSGNTLGNLSYAYDQDGRRIQLGGSWARTGIPNPTTSTSVYNAANELTDWNGATLAYDANGNMTSDGTNTYTWNARNQLASISGLTSASFEYDPFGRRLQKTISGATSDFLYDGRNPVQELSGSTVTANLLTGLEIDEYFARTDPLGTSNYLTDALGSSLALADTTGTVQTEYTYDPFGKTTSQGAASVSFYQFTGRENDGDGLYYFRARYYDPSLGRFVSEDPIGFRGGENFYSYVQNNPVTFNDPRGTIPFISCIYYRYRCIWTGLQCRQDLDRASGHNDAILCEATQSPNPDDAYFKVCFQGNYYCEKAIEYCGADVVTPR